MKTIINFSNFIADIKSAGKNGGAGVTIIPAHQFSKLVEKNSVYLAEKARKNAIQFIDELKKENAEKALQYQKDGTSYLLSVPTFEYQYQRELVKYGEQLVNLLIVSEGKENFFYALYLATNTCIKEGIPFIVCENLS